MRELFGCLKGKKGGSKKCLKIDLSRNIKKRWREDFRINGFSFQKLIDLVSPQLRKNDTKFWKTIEIEKRVAISLWRLATGNSHRTII